MLALDEALHYVKGSTEYQQDCEETLAPVLGQAPTDDDPKMDRADSSSY
jgi:hypothetical protein